MAKVAVRKSVTGNGLLTGLVAYWPMNEATGDLLDVVGSFDLADFNAPDSAVGKVYATARQFTRASSQYFQAAAYNALNELTGPFTIAWWEHPYSYTHVPAQYNDVFTTGGGTSTTGGVLIRHTHDGGIVIYLSANDGVNLWQGHTLEIPTLNAWNLSVWTYDRASGGITYRLNMNAQKDYTWEAQLGAAHPDLRVVVGKTPTALTHYYDGRIGPLAIWERVLTSAQRIALWNDGNGIPLDSFTA